MGYVLFASRKVALTSRLNSLQAELMAIENEKQSLLNYQSAIADGDISSDEWAENTDCYSSFGEFMNKAYDQNVRNKEIADASIATSEEKYHLENEAPTTAEESAKQAQDLEELRRSAIQDVISKYASNVENKRLEAIENQLDMKMKRIETKITATETELQNVEKAEATAIQTSTPKYSGLG